MSEQQVSLCPGLEGVDDYLVLPTCLDPDLAGPPVANIPMAMQVLCFKAGTAKKDAPW